MHTSWGFTFSSPLFATFAKRFSLSCSYERNLSSASSINVSGTFLFETLIFPIYKTCKQNIKHYTALNAKIIMFASFTCTLSLVNLFITYLYKQYKKVGNFVVHVMWPNWAVLWKGFIFTDSYIIILKYQSC